MGGGASLSKGKEEYTRMSLISKIGEGGVNDLKKILRSHPLIIDSWVTRMHSVLTVANVVGEKGLRPLGDLMAQPEEELKKQACKVAKRLSELQGSHRPWAIRLVATELLALCNLVAQFFFIDHFVGGGFLSLGFDLLNDTECSPGEKLFPIRAACKQFTKGSGGGDQHKGLTCVLTTNMWNRKFYTFLHFWFVVLSVITFIGAIYRILTIFMPSFRPIKGALLRNGKGTGLKRDHLSARISRTGSSTRWF